MWRKRMQDLSRAAGQPHEPLFAPLLFGVAAQIEATSLDAMADDATRIRKNISELRRALKIESVFCCAPGDAEAQAIGRPDSEIDMSRIAGEGRIAASIGAVRQWQADASLPVIAAALRGPASIAAMLRESGVDVDDEALFDHVGRGLAILARLFCEAGIHVLQWHETVVPPDSQLAFWKGALGTAGNVARFHRVPPLLVMATPEAPGWPAQAIASPTPLQHGGAMPRPHGRAWPANPASWPALPGLTASERIVTTVAEVPVEMDFATLLAEVQRVQAH